MVAERWTALAGSRCRFAGGECCAATTAESINSGRLFSVHLLFAIEHVWCQLKSNELRNRISNNLIVKRPFHFTSVR